MATHYGLAERRVLCLWHNSDVARRIEQRSIAGQITIKHFTHIALRTQ